MRALVCRQWGKVEQLQLEDNYPDPAVGDTDVLVAVKAAGLNFLDTLIIEGKYQLRPEFPFIPGCECAGVVEAVGKDVSDVNVGDKVMVSSDVGAFADKIACPQTAIIAMPEGIDFTVAAGIGIAYFTSYYAFKQRAALQAGETVLVLGAGGGVGITAVEIAKAMGATVIAAASSAEKLAFAQSRGADHLINYSEESLKDRLKQITGGNGVDVVYDPVGGDFSETALRAMAWNGRFLVIGFANGEIPRIALNLTLLKGCQIVGVFLGAFRYKEPAEHRRNIDELWAMIAAGTLSPVATDVFTLDNYADGYHCLIQRKARGKVILQMQP